MEPNEVLVNNDHVLSIKQHDRRSVIREQAAKICRICGDEIGLRENGDLFVACNECAFPVCRPCYEYERMEGQGTCPQCHTRYKRHKGRSSFKLQFFYAHLVKNVVILMCTFC